jgi:hypothetical protein
MKRPVYGRINRSQWPRGLRRRSSAAGTVGSNPAGGMDVSLL